VFHIRGRDCIVIPLVVEDIQTHTITLAMRQGQLFEDSTRHKTSTKRGHWSENMYYSILVMSHYNSAKHII